MEKVESARVWMDIEDHLVPQQRLGAFERALYYHLFRHSRLLGNRTVCLPISALARGTRLTSNTVRKGLRSLAHKQCVKIARRDRLGHTVEVLAPVEIRGCMGGEALPAELGSEAGNWYHEAELRTEVVRREQGRCFYCLREIPTAAAFFDHVVPVSRGGEHSYRNLVACCFECNSAKQSKPADDFLRQLYRSNRLSGAELAGRLAALEGLRRALRLRSLRLRSGQAGQVTGRSDKPRGYRGGRKCARRSFQRGEARPFGRAQGKRRGN